MAVPILAICLTVIDPLSIFSLLRAVKQIRSRVQSVPKNDRVDDLATTDTTKTCDADFTSIVLEIQLIFGDHQPSETRATGFAGLRSGTGGLSSLPFDSTGLHTPCLITRMRRSSPRQVELRSPSCCE
jgi:hypothetical protein